MEQKKISNSIKVSTLSVAVTLALLGGYGFIHRDGIGGPAAPTGEYPLEGWHQVMDINLNGVFYGLRYEIPAILASGVRFDMLFGPAYKGITLASAAAVELSRLGRNVPFAFNRKEAKAHGEGGMLVGAVLRGRVVIVDDVITDGASKRESVEMIRQAGAEPSAVLIALDRMERGGPDDNLSARSAVEDFEHAYGFPVISIATLTDLLQYLRAAADPALAAHFARVAGYRERYGV